MIECYNRRQEELLEYLFKEFKDTSGLKKLFIDLSPFSKGKEGIYTVSYTHLTLPTNREV